MQHGHMNIKIKDTADEHLCPQKNSNPKFQQSKCQRRTPQTTRPAESASYYTVYIAKIYYER